MVGKFTKIRLILTAVLAFITAAVLSFAVFAATNVRLTGSGGLEYEASGEQPPDPVTPPTGEEAAKQEERLTNSGFVVEEGELCYWFKYEKQEQNVDEKYLISHQRRLSDNTLDGERARVAVSWNTAVEVAGVTAYEVRCEHNAEGLIGYFTEDRTFFGADGRPISR